MDHKRLVYKKVVYLWPLRNKHPQFRQELRKNLDWLQFGKRCRHRSSSKASTAWLTMVAAASSRI